MIPWIFHKELEKCVLCFSKNTENNLHSADISHFIYLFLCFLFFSDLFECVRECCVNKLCSDMLGWECMGVFYILNKYYDFVMGEARKLWQGSRKYMSKFRIGFHTFQIICPNHFEASVRIILKYPSLYPSKYLREKSHHNFRTSPISSSLCMLKKKTPIFSIQ
jgi:hypothetical protein